MTYPAPSDFPHLAGLAVALAVGLLIGLERGWQDRLEAEGRRVAGFRTFALTGLLGGIMATLQPLLGAWPLAAGLLGVALLLAATYDKNVESSGSLSITSAIAMLLTYVLGALAVADATLALGAAVIVAVLLHRKSALHAFLRKIEAQELTAALQLLVLSVVILPYLPDRGYGPYAALNPYVLWWAVVLISSLSLLGHLAMRMTGTRRGILWTGLLGGLASSTATTLTLARVVRDQPTTLTPAMAGMTAASGVMYLRMLTFLSTLAPAMLPSLGLALLAGAAVLLLQGWRLHRNNTAESALAQPVVMLKAFDLGTALTFGLFLAGTAVLVPAAREFLGNSGLYLLAFVSGLADVDAILVTLMRMSGAGEGAAASAATAAATPVQLMTAMGLAVLANMLSKAALCGGIAGPRAGLRLFGHYLLSMAVAAGVAALCVILAR